MKTSRLLSVCALLSLGACGGARGGTSGDLDASTSTTDTMVAADVTTSDVTATIDVPSTPIDVPSTPVDVPSIPVDVPSIPVDVPSTPVDVPSTPVDVPSTPIDVPTARCGDGTCNEGESCASCRVDCASMCPPPVDVPTARCGDGTCNGAETCSSCATDCVSCTSTVTDPCAVGVAQGPGRDCGWRMGVTFPCSPGRATMVGCSGTAGVGSLCQPSYGVCFADPVMRVCPGTMPCTAAMALMPTAGSFDDQCGTCPSAYVTCPASGQVHVLTGDYDSNNIGQRGTCTAAVR